jgi:hypothetical protein
LSVPPEADRCGPSSASTGVLLDRHRGQSENGESWPHKPIDGRDIEMAEKIPWQGTVLSVQPRIKLMRSFDERSHSYLQPEGVGQRQLPDFGR